MGNSFLSQLGNIGLIVRDLFVSARFTRCKLRLSVLLWCLGSALAIAQEPLSFSRSTGKTDEFTPDNVCGARCVQYLLHHYQVDSPDLLSVVRELQWPEIQAGASLADIQRLLVKHGVQTRPIKFPASHVVLCIHPCIVHLRPTPPSTIGHYVLLLPGSTWGRVQLWDVDGPKEVPAWELAAKASGAALLTCPAGAPVSDMDVRVVITADEFALRSGYLTLGLLSMIVAGASFSASRRCRLRRLSPVGGS